MIAHMIIDAEEDISGVGLDLAQVLVDAKMVDSKTEARRQIKQGAVRLNDSLKVQDQFARLTYYEFCATRESIKIIIREFRNIWE